ncbi:MAG: conserved hypothetical rane protein [Devosia sp.]|nr:conserved hypothetical rane protein [Devosia sp.]
MTAKNNHGAIPSVTDLKPKTTRIEWIDSAKGLSILLVVFYHATTTLAAVGAPVQALSIVNDALQPVRLPLLFLAAGLVAGSALSWPLSRIWLRRIALYAYLFILWSVIRFAFFAIVPNPTNLSEGRNLSSLPGFILQPDNGAWFLWALGIFFFLAAMTRGIDRRFMLPVAAFAALLGFGDILPISFSAANLLKFFLFFYAGWRYRGAITAMVERRSGLFLATLPIYAAVLVLDWASDSHWLSGAFLLIAAILATTTVPVALRLVSGTCLGSTLAYFGRHSLSIYLIHFPIVAFLAIAFDRTALKTASAALILPLVTSAIAVITSLALERSADRAGLSRWLFRLPIRNTA